MCILILIYCCTEWDLALPDLIKSILSLTVRLNAGKTPRGRNGNGDSELNEGRKSLSQRIRHFYAEAQELRQGLVQPSFREVLKLTVFAIVVIAVSMILLTTMDKVFYKLVGERFVQKWAAAQAKAGRKWLASCKMSFCAVLWKSLPVPSIAVAWLQHQ